MLTTPRSVAAERFRRLKTTLSLQSTAQSMLLVITSGAPSEGKSTVALNLALAFAAEEDRTLLVDADLRRPSLGSRLEPPPAIGLSQVLRGEAELGHAVLRVEDSLLKILPAGGSMNDPLSLLGSSAARELTMRLREQYRRIIFDTPPVTPFSDADAIAAYSDGVLIVVRSGRTPVTVVQDAIASVTSAKILGTVFNDAKSTLIGRGRYHSEYYSHYYGREKDSSGGE